MVTTHGQLQGHTSIAKQAKYIHNYTPYNFTIETMYNTQTHTSDG